MPLLMLAALLLLCSCGDKRLEDQAKEQAKEIATLEAKIAAIESELASMPPDVTPALDEARAKLKEQLDQTTKLEEEVKDLESRKAKLEKTLEETKRKYPLGNPFPRPTQTR